MKLPFAKDATKCDLCGSALWAHYPYAPDVTKWMPEDLRSIFGALGAVLPNDSHSTPVNGNKFTLIHLGYLVDLKAVTPQQADNYVFGFQRHLDRAVQRYALRLSRADKYGVALGKQVNVVANIKTERGSNAPVTQQQILQRISGGRGHSHNFTNAHASAGNHFSHYLLIPVPVYTQLSNGRLGVRGDLKELNRRLDKTCTKEQRFPCPIHRKLPVSVTTTE